MLQSAGSCGRTLETKAKSDSQIPRFPYKFVDLTLPLVPLNVESAGSNPTYDTLAERGGFLRFYVMGFSFNPML